MRIEANVEELTERQMQVLAAYQLGGVKYRVIEDEFGFRRSYGFVMGERPNEQDVSDILYWLEDNGFIDKAKQRPSMFI